MQIHGEEQPSLFPPSMSTVALWRVAIDYFIIAYLHFQFFFFNVLQLVWNNVRKELALLSVWTQTLSHMCNPLGLSMAFLVWDRAVGLLLRCRLQVSWLHFIGLSPCKSSLALKGCACEFVGLLWPGIRDSEQELRLQRPCPGYQAPW